MKKINVYKPLLNYNIMNSNKEPYKILKAYKCTGDDTLIPVIFGIGYSTLGAILNNTPATIGGGIITGVSIVYHCFEYVKAYMEAQLDFQKNKRFTRLEDKVD